ncbi:MAG: hypothetical protein WD969_12430 [Paracoccaceae bacterium]
MRQARNSAGRAALIAACVLGLVACVPEPEPGAPDISHLTKPLSADYLQIVSAAPELVEVDAAGRIVRAVPPPGLCIPLDSIQTAPAAVFLIYNECPGGVAAALGGVLSVSISKEPLSMEFATLQRFFETRPGRAGLGYGGSADDISLVETKADPHALYAVVEDKSELGPAFAGDLICRAFTEVNDRMVVLTLISRRSDPAEGAAMRARLTRIVAALHEGNS